MEVSPYSNQPVSGNIGNVGNVGSVGNWSNAGISPVSNPVHEFKPEYKPAEYKPEYKPAEYKPEYKPVEYKPEYKPASKCSTAPIGYPGKGKGGSAPYGKAGGVAPGAAAGKTTENTLHCPPAQGGTVYDPQTVNVQHIYKPVIVKHIHQLHTIRKTHYIYEHQHYYPHTLSETCDERHYDVQCGKPCFPKPHC
ncbi:CotD family spore coat protein [Sporolactobacillus shoreicorticis]|uniref:CotD family spore coat protein n=1 Tax=Sporolactobacillus shoreicorticis TaxID=1923877 RepID=A0ABW5RY60_9BACL|nr:CotD family spore coat protein [Sporolactobacillus shoreicorticis]MCO7125051.1 CotD family spore coat protein [Sporolactobacillus shoreicorticis]